MQGEAYRYFQPMESAQIHPNVIKVFIRTLAIVGVPAVDEQWVPIGMVGPVLILAHHADTPPECPLPAHLCERVRIESAAYSAVSAQVITAGQSYDMVGDILFDPTESFGFAEDSVRERFAYMASAVDTFSKHFVLPDALQQGIEGLIGKTINNEKELPPGFAEAIRFFVSRSLLVHLHRFGQTQHAGLIPESVSDRIACACIGEQQRNERRILLIAVCSDTPVSVLEDELHRTVGAADPTMGFDFVYAEHGDLERYRRRLGVVRSKRNVVSVRKRTGANYGHVENTMTQEVDMRIAYGQYDRFDPSRPDATSDEILGWILQYAIEAGVSDIHIEAAFGRGQVRFRVDGVLKTVLEMNKDVLRGVVGVSRTNCGMSTNSFDAQDKSLAVRYGEEVTKLRVSAMPTYTGIQKIVMRLLPKTPPVSSIYEMGMSTHQLATIRDVIRKPQGLIVVSGPTGSGKTTTIYSILNEINQPDINIQTVEDPVEYVMEGVNQTPTDDARGVGFQSLMRAILRQDPDVVFIGEMRDRESAIFAVEASLTGHLVLSTLHSLSAAKIIQRMVEMGVPKELLSESLALLEAQRLIKRLHPSHRREVSVTPAQQAVFDRYKISCDAPCLYVPDLDSRGDPVFGGRTAIIELIPVKDDIAELISRESSSRLVRDMANKQGHLTYFQAALTKVVQGEVAFKDAMVFED